MFYENEEEKKQIFDLCDLALRAGGLQNKSGVDKLLSNLKPIEETEKKDLPSP